MRKEIKIVILIILLVLLKNSTYAERISLNDFSSNSILIDFSDVQFTDPYSGNGALTPILDYKDQGVLFKVHNEQEFVGTRHDVFRLGGWGGQGLSIATNVGDDASIELNFKFPVSQIGALVSVSNAELQVYNGGSSFLESGRTQNVEYDQSAGGLKNTEFIGIESKRGIKSASFKDISPNGLIMAIDNVIFTPGFDAVIDAHSTFVSENFTLRETFSFDYWWEMGTEPTSFNLDILFFNGNGWEILGGIPNFDGSSDEWNTFSLIVPEWARGLETQIKFRLFDLGQETDPTVYLRNISSVSASVPEPATMLLLGLGLVGMAGARRKFIL